MLVTILETTKPVEMSVRWYLVLDKGPYDAKNAMNKTLGLLLIEPQTEVFMLLLDMLETP